MHIVYGRQTRIPQQPGVQVVHGSIHHIIKKPVTKTLEEQHPTNTTNKLLRAPIRHNDFPSINYLNAEDIFFKKFD